MKSFVLFVFCLFATATLRAQQINLKPGDEFAIQTHSIETLTAKKKTVNTEAYTFQFKVLDKSSDNYKLECRLINAKIWREDKLYRLNSDSVRNTELNYSGLLTQLILLHGPVTFVINNKGKVLSTGGVDDLIKQVTKNWYLRDDLISYEKQNVDGFLNWINSFFLQLPNEKIGYQSTWLAADGKSNFKVTAIRGSLLDIELSNVDSKTQNKYLFNEVNGLVENAHSTFTSTDNGEAKNHDYTQTLIYGKADGSGLDTAWLNMAVPLSYWSEYFKNKAGEIDSAKLSNYTKKYDSLYQNDLFYVNAKLSKANSSRGEGAFTVYRAMLAKTPNKFLDGQDSHLFNKTQWASEINADTAYNVITYFHKSPEFEPWLQESFSQAFLNENDVVATQLIEKLNADKKLNVKTQIYPMYLWVAATKQPSNLKLLTKTYSQFMKMDDKFMHQGNGARYALLVYKLLVSAGKQKEAANLLDRTTNMLERFNADTLNKNRFADRNILAYTYYLKYQVAAGADSAAALQYLAKAAQYSPKNKKERAYLSFYDRVFLHSKENYSDDFLNRLFATGQNDEALKVFADNITANPTDLEAVQKVYQKHFPGKSFKDFFINNVVSNWAEAPAFELTDLDGKKRALADYKNKWLVVDFWGTWCGPCREEMPKVNAFNQELVDGKHNGVHLLSIACYDNQSAVKKYVTENNIGITVAMSDNSVQKNYKISGYPSKILISPNRKMIDIAFGADWQSVIKKFNEVYAAN